MKKLNTSKVLSFLGIVATVVVTEMITEIKTQQAIREEVAAQMAIMNKEDK